MSKYVYLCSRRTMCNCAWMLVCIGKKNMKYFKHIDHIPALAEFAHHYYCSNLHEN